MARCRSRPAPLPARPPSVPTLALGSGGEGRVACNRTALALTYNQMVVERQTDRVFHALADATRRDIVRRTMQREYSVSALARLYPMSFAAVQKHVAVLEGADLVSKRRRGREQLVSGNVRAVHEAALLLDQLEALWRSRIDRFGEVLAEDPDQGAPT